MFVKLLLYYPITTAYKQMIYRKDTSTDYRKMCQTNSHDKKNENKST